MGGVDYGSSASLVDHEDQCLGINSKAGSVLSSGHSKHFLVCLIDFFPMVWWSGNERVYKF